MLGMLEKPAVDRSQAPQLKAVSRAWRKGMKVFVLGGYGKTGFPTIKLLEQSDLVTEIAIGGRSLERAEKAATEIGVKANAVCVDAVNEQKLASLIEGYDIILNAADNEVVLPSIRAAIRNGIHYCDISWGGILDQALQLVSEAKAAGITVIIANGISPCISNLMGVYVARQLDEVDQLQIGRAEFFNFKSGRELTPKQWIKDPKESLATLYEFKPYVEWMFQRLQENGIRTVLHHQDGRWVEVDPIIKGLEIPIPKGSTTTSHPFGSGDDFFGMMPRDLSKISPVEIWFSPLPTQLHAFLREQALRVLEDNIEYEIAIDSFYDTIESDPYKWLILPDNFEQNSKMWVRAVGYKEGRLARQSCWFTADMWNVGGYFMTSVALATAVRKLLRGDIRERGVFTAEKAFEPLPFLDEVASLIQESLPDGEMLGESFEWLD
jgi:hypothetical protein